MNMEYNSATDSFSEGFRTIPAKDLEQGERARFPGARERLDYATPAPQPRVEVGRGGTEVTIRNGQMTVTKDSDKANTFEASTGFAREGDLLSTARSATGAPVTGRALIATDTVEFGGQRAPLAVWERMNIVTRDSAGNWTATAEGNAGATMPEGKKVTHGLADGGTVEAAEEGAFRADDATENTLAELVAGVSQSTNMAMVNAYAFNGEIDPKIVARAAQQIGADPEDLAAKYQTAAAGMEAAMEERLASFGVFDADLFAGWVQADAERIAAGNKALFALITSNSTEGFDKLAEGFVQSLDQIAPAAVTEALEEAGIPFRKDGSRVILTLPDGAQVSYGVAVRQGLIKVSKG